ncbi:SET and MYND domain-containing protein 4 isoform X1 [Pleurodeles waltl]|uniref:SET and MYND domain-containing protein 4 isoform X1 n=1 Tax=Pleurodeles waltl TaxID=8319 RepID=UPI0037097DCD
MVVPPAWYRQADRKKERKSFVSPLPMELPVEEWQAYARRKWAASTPSFKEKFSPNADLMDSIVACQLHTEDENVLRMLGVEYSVSKDPCAATIYKEEGNKKFQRKEYDCAAALYSKAASHAVYGDEELAVCYANRSAALFYMGHFEVCLEDIERALESGYPKRLQHKVLMRKADCLLHLGRCQEAIEVIRSMEELVESSSLASNTKESLLSSIVNLKSKVSGNQNNSESSISTCLKTQKDTVLPGEVLRNDLEDLRIWDENANISKASAALSARVSPDRGRHLVAVRNIDPGEMLVKEEAFVSLLVPEGLRRHMGGDVDRVKSVVTNADLHCHLCLDRAQATVPCRGCSYARYCSQQCMERAWGSYHWLECSIGSSLLALGVFCHLALRTVLVAGFGNVTQLVKKHYLVLEEQTKNKLHLPPPQVCSGAETGKSMEAPALIEGSGDDGRYHSSYRSVFSLVTHGARQSPERRFLCALSATAICRMLSAADVLSLVSGQRDLEDRSKMKTDVNGEMQDTNILGVAMLHHMLQLQCNALAVTRIQEHRAGESASTVESQEQVRLATALFPVTSLLNHSCDPNTSISFRGRSAIIRAAQPIRSGEEVTLCYGPHRSRMTLSKRRQMLSHQYFFECQCHACLEELASNVQSSLDSFSCPTCKAPMQGETLLSCSSGVCGLTIPSECLVAQQHNLELRVSKAVDLLEADKPGLALQILADCRSRAQGFLCSEHVLAARIEDHLARAHAARGDWQSAAVHLRSSLRNVELRHGASSIELGHELVKLAQIFFNGRAVPEAMDTILRAEQILTVHYGTQHELLQELREMKACLLDLRKVTGSRMKSTPAS